MDQDPLPAGIRRRGSSFLVDCTHNGVRRTATCKTLADAVETQGSIRAELLRSSIPEEMSYGNSWTLQKAFDVTCDVAWNESEAKSWQKLRDTAEMVLQHFGPTRRLDSIKTSDVDTFEDVLRKVGNGNATINRKLAALRRMITVAEEREGCTKSPVIDWNEEPPGRERYMSLEEEQAWIKECGRIDKPDHLDAFCILIDTGLRPSELWRVMGRDLRNGFVVIPESKNGKKRSVPLVPRSHEIMQRRAAKFPVSPLFTVEDVETGGLKVADIHWFARVWRRIKDNLGISDDGYIPYMLRHTCASRLSEAGENLQTIAEWMGHKDLKTTRRYTHLSPSHLLDAAKALQRLVSKTK